MDAHIMTLTLPKPFRDGPQFDENGDLVGGSWPAGFTTQGILGWIPIGTEVAGRVMVDAVIDGEHIDDWVDNIPAGWTKASHHSWNKRSYDLGTLTPTDQDEYKKHKPPEVDENGDPLTDPVTYSRIHKILGWPDIED